MTDTRLSLARAAGHVPPLFGRMVVFGQITPKQLSGLDGLDLTCVTTSFSVNRDCTAQGYSCQTAPDGHYDNACVFLPRAKAEARDLIAQAVASAPQGWVIVDGAKTDGIDSIYRELTKVSNAVGRFAKAHGKVIWAPASELAALTGWRFDEQTTADGYVTAPGVFSADGVDPASEFLMQHLPQDVSGAVADLGAGWGYLSRAMLDTCKAIRELHLVEDNAIALDCARRNLDDPRAQFYWADALTWSAPGLLDYVVMNPPFHTSRSADPDLGRGFIQAAARALRPGGQLYMVANAHLPYEATLQTCFATSQETARNGRFKIFHAEKARGKTR